MNTKYTIRLLCGLLIASVAINVVLANTNLGYYDKAYGALAEQHLLNSRLRAYLQDSDIDTAKKLLDHEIETKGTVLVICLMENCSETAARLMNGAGDL